MMAVLCVCGAVPALCQDMEPRAYSRAPVGTQSVLLTYAYQSGDLLTDSALPLQDVSVHMNSATVGYARTFGLLKKQANFGVAIPYIYAKVRGEVFEREHEVTRSGLGDMRLRFTTHIFGAPALSPKEFSAHKPHTLVGLSLSMILPTGQYDPRRLVNLGSNRWAFKPEVGISKPIGPWTIEVAGGAWLFTANKKFFGGVKREQKPLLSLQGHLIYTFRPRMWAAVDGTYYNGGRTVVNNKVNADIQSNSRIGATFAYPLGEHQSLKVIWARGVTTRIGGNLNTIAVSWNYTWF
jgi:hypothetical protein